MLQAYTNSLFFFPMDIYMLSVVHVQSNVIWSKTIGKIHEGLWGYHNHNIGICDFIVEQNQDQNQYNNKDLYIAADARVSWLSQLAFITKMVC